LKFGEVVVIQGNYKILQSEHVKTLWIASVSQFEHVSHVVAVLDKKKQRTLGVMAAFHVKFDFQTRYIRVWKTKEINCKPPP
jgi:hypothetical protein